MPTSSLSDLRYPGIPLGVECALPWLGQAAARLSGYSRFSPMSKNSATYSDTLPSASRTAEIDSQAR